MQIRRIKPTEYQLAASLFNDYRVFYKYPADLPLAEKFIKERLENNESVIFVAFADDNTPFGFTQLYPLISSTRATKNWVLNDLYVDAGYRKQGIGEALIKTAMEFAQGDGATFVQLETAIDNYNAQHLYENIGFEKQAPDADYFTYRIPLK